MNGVDVGNVILVSYGFHIFRVHDKMVINIKSTEGVILFITIRDVHQFVVHCLIPLEPCLFCHERARLFFC